MCSPSCLCVARACPARGLDPFPPGGPNLPFAIAHGPGSATRAWWVPPTGLLSWLPDLSLPPICKESSVSSVALAVSPTHPPQHSDEPLPTPPGQASPWSHVLRALHGVGRAEGQRRTPEMNWGTAPPTSSFLALAPARAPACHGLIVPLPCGQHKVYICFVPLPVSVHNV